jgi:hypothetical protein
MTRATATAGTKLIDQIDLVACLSKQRSEALAFDRLLELTMLALFEITNSDDGLLATSKQLLESFQQTCFRYLTTDIATKLELSEDILVVEWRQALVEFVLFRYVRFEAFEVCSFPVVGTQLGFPLYDALTIYELLLALLEVVSVLLCLRFLTARVLCVAKLNLLSLVAIHTV